MIILGINVKSFKLLIEIMKKMIYLFMLYDKVYVFDIFFN